MALVALPRGGQAAPEKPKGKPVAKASSKAQVNAERKKCANGMHYVLKLRCDNELVNDLRMFCLGSKAQVDEICYYWSEVKDAATTKMYWANLANGAWMEPLRDALRTLGNTTALARCGFLTDPVLAEKLALDAPELCIEDARAQRFLGFVVSVVRQRAARLERENVNRAIVLSFDWV